MNKTYTSLPTIDQYPTAERVFINAVCRNEWSKAITVAPQLRKRQLCALIELPLLYCAGAIVLRSGPNELCEAFLGRVLDNEESLTEAGVSNVRSYSKERFFTVAMNGLRYAVQNRSWDLVMVFLAEMLSIEPQHDGYLPTMEREVRNICVEVGKAEVVLVEKFPEIELSPHATMPSIDSVKVCTGPDSKCIGLLSEILQVIVSSDYRAVADRVFIEGMLHCHWPTWRSVSWYLAQRSDLAAALPEEVRRADGFPIAAITYIDFMADLFGFGERSA